MDGNNFSPFPHHKLQAFEVALEFIRLIRHTHISDAENRKHERGSARSCARNLAQGAGRRSRADKRRCYSIAHGELAESVGCVEIDNAEGGCSEQQLQAVHKLGSRLNAMLTSLTR
jgi:four helix bundle protein